jgi:putative membrane protein
MTKSKLDRQREHQANERTFLAWLRTAIALIGFGFAIARFGLFLHQLQLTLTQQPDQRDQIFNSETLGAGLVAFGILTIALAAWRYNQVFRQIEQGDYRPSRLLVWVMTGAVIVFGMLSLPLLLMKNKPLSSPQPRPQQPL